VLLIITDRQIICPPDICAGCLWATTQGQPRWRQGQLCCGQQINQRTADEQPSAYQCQMGFKLVNIQD
jgi:hypothetical protein